eukprot:scaffold138492_cov16-Tisochrysis_lutea.AAC.4
MAERKALQSSSILTTSFSAFRWHTASFTTPAFLTRAFASQNAPQSDVGCAHIPAGGELDALFGGVDLYGVPNAGQVPADPLVLSRGHLHFSRVVLVRDAQ